MKKLYSLLTLIFASIVAIIPCTTTWASTITDGGKPYSHNLGLDWWVILLLALCGVGAVGLITYIIVDTIKNNKKDKDNK